MWRILYPFRQGGLHFRRQVQIGAYYVDFACMHPGIVIEVDGDSHRGDLVQSNDAVRDDYLRGRGFRVLRFGNRDVLRNPAGVYETIDGILAELTQRGAPPTPASLRLSER
jgi:very-short-patch-repair endonuclease